MKRYKVSFFGCFILLMMIVFTALLYFFPSVVLSFRNLVPIRIENHVADGAVKKDKLLFETTSTIGLNENLAYFYSNSEIELYFNEKSVFKTRINGELCKNYLGVSVLTYKKKAIFLENFGEKARLHIVNCENDSEDEVVDLGVNERSSFSFAVNEEIKEVMVYSYSCDANGDQSTLFVYSLEDGNELIEKKDDCFTVNGRMVTEICECFSDGNERYFLFKGVVFGNDATKFLFEEERFLCQVLSVETEKNGINLYFAPNHSGPLGGGYEICVCGKQMHDFSDYNADFFKNEYEMIFSVFKHGSVEVELFPFERKTYFVIKREKGNERWIGYMDDSGVIKFQKVKRGIKSIIASNGTLYLEFKNGYYKV